MTSPAAVATGAAETWGSAWTAALDALELEVGRVEALLVDDHAQRDAGWAALATSHLQWTAPIQLPPLPAELAERALTVLHRQTAAAAALALAMTSNRRQSRMVARMSTDEAARPAYIDHAV
ncbi:MAG TPA: hypothetical protein VGP02_00925 [Mycobacteriales bacterium]|nr:hypothetical protein [Mycobacteriales bacterium]